MKSMIAGTSYDSLRFVERNKTRKLSFVEWTVHTGQLTHRIMSFFDNCLPAVYKVIMLTRLCNVYPLTLHFYIVKLGFRGVFIFFLFSKDRF